MAEHDRPSVADAPPWWLHGGTEECPHCGQLYHLETERRCGACDSPSCAHCHAAHERDCSPSGEEARDR
ncbi:hypothetical protein JI739_21815 [Ramlibacter sp. AW1]|uniref:Uncharacterized protein n=1 Tax=Ramlibacter aurantiacus TaxID=2801330 RepID=A0A937D3R9_9BURK|nr:hypothetical protein [Ramlibacter aurantiacus]MBL0422989.1 hypothetical protein [Ramlibacter aurantiacus]